MRTYRAAGQPKICQLGILIIKKKINKKGGEVDNPRPDQQQQQLDNTPATQSRYGHDTDMEGNQVADGSR